MTDQEAGPVQPAETPRPNRPALTINKAAEAADVHRNTIRRRLDDGQFPNAFREPGEQGRKAWLIPVGDLLAAGLHLHRPSPADQVAAEETLDELQALRADNLELRHRAELAESLARERERALTIAERALLALTEGESRPSPPDRSPIEEPTAPTTPEPTPTAPAPRGRRWPWSRRSQ